MRQLSKSKIIAFRQCPKRLWLELHRPELRDDSGSQIVFAIGNQVGDVARQIYDTNGNGKLIDVNEIGWSAAYEESEKWLQGTPAPLFEAAIRIEGALALADVMLPEPGAERPPLAHDRSKILHRRERLPPGRSCGAGLHRHHRRHRSGKRIARPRGQLIRLPRRGRLPRASQGSGSYRGRPRQGR